MRVESEFKLALIKSDCQYLMPLKRLDRGLGSFKRNTRDNDANDNVPRFAF